MRHRLNVAAAFVAAVVLITSLPASSDEQGYQLPSGSQMPAVNQPPGIRPVPIRRPCNPEDILIVCLADGADRDKFDHELGDLSSTVIQTVVANPKLSFLYVQVPPGQAAAMEKQLLKTKDVSFVERNRIYSTNGKKPPKKKKKTKKKKHGKNPPPPPPPPPTPPPTPPTHPTTHPPPRKQPSI